MLKTEEEIRSMYRNYIELFACSDFNNKSDRDILYGAILAYGRVLGFKLVKIDKDIEFAKNKYIKY